MTTFSSMPVAAARGEAKRGIPRAVVWLLLLCAALGLYLFVIEPGLDRYTKDSALAATREARLREYARSGDRLRTAGQAVSLGVRKFGEIAMPGDPQKRPLEFGSVVDDILRNNQITDVTSSTRSSPMNTGALPTYVKGLGGGGGASREAKVERVVKKLSFAATPEQFASALAELEKHPLVVTISDLRVRQGDGDDKADRKLRIDMDVETWVSAAVANAMTRSAASPAAGSKAGAEKPAEKPVDKPAEKPADKAGEKASEKASDKSGGGS